MAVIIIMKILLLNLKIRLIILFLSRDIKIYGLFILIQKVNMKS